MDSIQVLEVFNALELSLSFASYSHQMPPSSTVSGPLQVASRSPSSFRRSMLEGDERSRLLRSAQAKPSNNSSSG